MGIVYNIEILKDGDYFIVRVYLTDGSIQEYRHQNFEDVLTEMVIDLQDVMQVNNQSSVNSIFYLLCFV